MNEQFEHRALIEIGTLRRLQARRDLPSLVRLTVHLASFALLCIAVPLLYDHALLAALCASALAWVWSGRRRTGLVGARLLRLALQCPEWTQSADGRPRGRLC